MDIDRIIGKLEEAGKHTESRLNSIESKLDTLLADKWKLHGASIVACGILSIIISLLVAMSGK